MDYLALADKFLKKAEKLILADDSEQETPYKIDLERTNKPKGLDKDTVIPQLKGKAKEMFSKIRNIALKMKDIEAETSATIVALEEAKTRLGAEQQSYAKALEGMMQEIGKYTNRAFAVVDKEQQTLMALTIDIKNVIAPGQKKQTVTKDMIIDKLVEMYDISEAELQHVQETCQELVEEANKQLEYVGVTTKTIHQFMPTEKDVIEASVRTSGVLSWFKEALNYAKGLFNEFDTIADEFDALIA